MIIVMDRKKFDLKPYRRGTIIWKFGLLVFMTVPLSVMYYKRHQKYMYARGMIKDMERMSESGRTIHEIPKYKDNGDEKRLQL